MVSEKNKAYAWYQEGLGNQFIHAENKELSNILPRLYGYHLVFLGDPGLSSLVETSLISHRVLVNPNAQAGLISNLRGEIEALPLRTDSVDVVVLSHTLEHAADPHQVLRETHRVLIPEGHVVITGFNPLSMWGCWHAWKVLRGQMTTQGKMLSPSRIKDWLKLLNFQIVGGRMYYFRPPLTNQKLHQKLNFMEKWGEKLWPLFGGAYSLVAVKRVVPLTPLRIKKRIGKTIWQPATEGLPKPTTTVQNNK